MHLISLTCRNIINITGVKSLSHCFSPSHPPSLLLSLSLSLSCRHCWQSWTRFTWRLCWGCPRTTGWWCAGPSSTPSVAHVLCGRYTTTSVHQSESWPNTDLGSPSQTEGELWVSECQRSGCGDVKCGLIVCVQVFKGLAFRGWTIWFMLILLILWILILISFWKTWFLISLLFPEGLLVTLL